MGRRAIGHEGSTSEAGIKIMLPITPKRRESKGGQAPLAEREGRALKVLPFNHAESPNRLWLYE